MYHGGWLLTHPEEDFSQMSINEGTLYTNTGGLSVVSDGDPPGGVQVRETYLYYCPRARAKG